MLYKAFISYSHAADGKLAPAIQSALHRFARPWFRRRALRIFRDGTNLSIAPGLWPTIEKALGASEYFILLASPEAAVSKWVDREVAHWLTISTAEKLLIVLTDGDLTWDSSAGDFNWERTSALPRNLTEVFTDEPLFLDLRWARKSEDLSLNNPGFRENIASLAATLHGRGKGRHHWRGRQAASKNGSTGMVSLIGAPRSCRFCIHCRRYRCFAAESGDLPGIGCERNFGVGHRSGIEHFVVHRSRQAGADRTGAPSVATLDPSVSSAEHDERACGRSVECRAQSRR